MKTKPVILIAALSAFALASASAQQEGQPPAAPANPPPVSGGAPPPPAFPAPPRGEPGHEHGDGGSLGGGPKGDRRDEDRPKGRPREDGPRDGDRPRGGPGPRDEDGPRGQREERDGPRRDGRPGKGPEDRMPNPHGGEKMEMRPFLGVLTTPVPPALAAQLGLPEGFGLVVQDVMPDEPAAAAGVQKYDILKLLNDQTLVDPSQLVTLLNAIGKDQTVTLTLLRKGQEQKVTATLKEHQLPVREAMRDGGPGRGPGLEMLGERLREWKGKGLGGEVEERVRGAVEHNKDIQEHLREVQRRLRERHEPDRPPGGPGGPGKPGADLGLDRLLPPPGSEPLRVESNAGVTTVDSSKARVHLKDREGEIEIVAEDGKRQLTAKGPDGAVIYQGAFGTPEEQASVPEPIRQRLTQMELHTQKERSNTKASSASAASSTAEVQ